MSRPWHRSAVLMAALWWTPAVAVFPTATSAQEAEAQRKPELAELLADAREYHVTLPLTKAEAKLREPTLLNFTNPQRNQECGSVLVWLDGSRPVAVGQFFRFDNRKGRLTKHAFHSLSESPLEVRFRDTLRWSPTEPGVKWQDVSDAPPPAENHAQRLLQMRQLARAYRLTLTGKEGEKSDLRLISRPLFDYEAASAGVLSGAIFSFVIATDPEALLLLEARGEGKEARYRFGFARFHYLPLTAHVGEREVWHVDLEPQLSINRPGDPVTMQKVYNSFYH